MIVKAIKTIYNSFDRPIITEDKIYNVVEEKESTYLVARDDLYLCDKPWYDYIRKDIFIVIDNSPMQKPKTIYPIQDMPACSGIFLNKKAWGLE